MINFLPIIFKLFFRAYFANFVFLESVWLVREHLILSTVSIFVQKLIRYNRKIRAISLYFWICIQINKYPKHLATKCYRLWNRYFISCLRIKQTLLLQNLISVINFLSFQSPCIKSGNTRNLWIKLYKILSYKIMGYCSLQHYFSWKLKLL